MQIVPALRFGAYRVFEPLAETRTTTVHRAELCGLDGSRTRVALHRLRPDTAPEIATTFTRKAKVAAQLQHPNIARVFNHGRIEGTPYVAMELVAGRSLHRCALGVPQVLGVLVQLCCALEHLHRRAGIAHGALSSGSVLIDRRGTVKIDCGRARTAADIASDILSVGVIAIELLDGMAVTPTVEDIIALALRRDRAQRWQSAAAMCVALDNASRELAPTLVA